MYRLVAPGRVVTFACLTPFVLHVHCGITYRWCGRREGEMHRLSDEYEVGWRSCFCHSKLKQLAFPFFSFWSFQFQSRPHCNAPSSSTPSSTILFHPTTTLTHLSLVHIGHFTSSVCFPFFQLAHFVTFLIFRVTLHNTNLLLPLLSSQQNGCICAPSPLFRIYLHFYLIVFLVTDAPSTLASLFCR